MPKARVRYYGLIRQVVGNKSLDEVEVAEGANLHNLIDILGDRYGSKFKNKLINMEGFLIAGSVVISVNDVRVNDLNLDVPIVGDSKVEIALSY